MYLEITLKLHSLLAQRLAKHAAANAQSVIGGPIQSAFLADSFETSVALLPHSVRFWGSLAPKQVHTVSTRNSCANRDAVL